MTDSRKRLYLGTSSFSTKDWVGPFYPPKTQPRDYLKYYASQFRAVEIDSTYYGVPRAQTIARWKDVTPEHFVMAAKFPRDIVHAGTGPKPNTEVLLTEDVYEVRDRFLAIMGGLGSRLGPLLLQFPFFSSGAFPSLEAFLERLEGFMQTLPREFRYGIEVRNPEFVQQATLDLCARHNAAFVLVDQAWMPHGDEVADRWNVVTTDFSYIRLLGDHKEMDRITTTWNKEVVDQSASIDRWAGVIRGLLSKEMPIFVFANNHYAGHAPATLRRLEKSIALLSGEAEDEIWRPDLFS